MRWYHYLALFFAGAFLMFCGAMNLLTGLVAAFAAVVFASATPRPVVDIINKHFNTLLVTQEAKEFLNKFGGDPYVTTPDEGQARLLNDIKAWGDYVRIAKIEPQG